MKSLHKTSASDEAMLERAIALAREADPPSLDDTDARRIVRRALLAGAGRRLSRAHSWRMVLAASAACAALAGVWAAGHFATQQRPRAAAVASGVKPLRMRLPSDDVLVASAGARFELRSATPESRLVELFDGAMLFEVIPLGSGQRFEVSTPHARVSVRGTVFTVQVTASRTLVRVYQGRVQVGTPAGSRALVPGESFASDGAAPGPQAAAVLHGEALAAVRRAEARVTARGAEAPAAVSEAEPPAAVSRAEAVQQTTATLQEPEVDRRAPRPKARERIRRPEREPPGISVATAHEQPRITRRQARAWLEQGEAERALEVAREAARAGGDGKGAWTMLEADALRALGLFGEAALAYERAWPLLPPGTSEQAGYLSALIYLQQLDSPQQALSLLDSAGVDAASSPLRERGLLLRVRALQRSGISPRSAACRYLSDYPDSVGAAEMRALCERPGTARGK